MNYPLLITTDKITNNFLVTVPDLPGCQLSTGSVSEGIEKIENVVTEHLSILAEYGEEIPPAKSIDYHMKNCDVDSPIWAVLNVDIVPFLGKSHKINVTLPELLIKKIDDRVNKSPAYKTRSGFIAAACLIELNKNT